MTKTIVNLALPMIVEAVEDVLDTYAYHPYQQAFSIPDLRQKLISYVLTRIPGLYAVIEDTATCTPDPSSLGFSVESCKEIKPLIHQGIQQIVEENAEWVDHHIPQEVSPELTPSTWFG